MFTQYTFYPIFGIPVIAYGGMLTLLSLLTTATIAFLNMKGNTTIPLKWHFIFARVTIILALVHGIFAFLSFIK